MFFWTRPWTTQVLVALASSDKPMPTIPEWIFEVWMDSFLLLPLAIVVGQVHIRLSASIKLPKAVRASLPPAIWTLLLQCLFSDVFFRLLLWSVAGLVDLQEDNSILVATDGWKDHWGWNGPFILFTVRLVVAILGVAVGETFFPLVLTGGIACGKSTVSKLLAEKAQFHMIDADKIGHQILLPPWHEQLNQPDALVTPNDSVYVRILETFANDADQAAAAATENNDSKLGTAVAGIHDKHPLLDDDKNIDRTKLGARIFATPAERQKLNAITHPKIFYCLLKNMAKSLYFGNDKPFVCAEVPLLFESGALRYIFGMVLVVACTETQQFNRLHKR
ncbi:CoA kinase domain-containing protein (Partial), partial [Seminavis robusta]|eukprot:Sro4430_g353990.1 CoA kinase domain-containing protein (334) ;mRNA; r:2-1004